MKKLVALVLAGVMLFSLGGCGAVEFDAQGYVQAVLDAKFHREYEDYAEIIGVKAEEAKEQMESEFNESLETAMQGMGLSSTEEEMAQYIQMEADVRAKVQYTVAEAVKDEDGNYTVEVTITPIPAYDNLESVFTDKLMSAVQTGATEDKYMSVFLESFQECIDSVVAGEPVTFTFHVTGEENGNQTVYSVSEDEMLNVDLVATGQATE